MKNSLIELKRERKSEYSPIPITDEDLDGISSAIHYMEKCLDDIFNKCARNYPSDLCSSLKKSRALKNLLFSRFYASISKEKRILHNSGASWDIQNYSETINISALRIVLFDIINEKYGGFVSDDSSEKEACFNNLQEKSNLPKNISNVDLEELIFCDHLEKLIIARRNETAPTAVEIIDAFNKDLLYSLIKSAHSITFYLNNTLTGTEYRKIFYIVSRSGFFIEFKLISTRETRQNLKIIIEKPNSLIKRPSKSAQRFRNIFNYIWQNFQHSMTQIPGINADYRKRQIIIHLYPLQSWFPIEKIKEQDIITFDSSIEEDLYNRIKTLNSIILGRIIRDAEIIISNDKVMIPDFQIKYADKSLFIEVVGFWTEGYKSKKLKTLKQLENSWINNIILYVDRSLNFPKTRFRAFYYHDKGEKYLPIKKLIGFIDEWQTPLYNSRKERLSVIIRPDLENMLKMSDKVEYYSLMTKWSLDTIRETEKILNDTWELLNLNEIAVKMPGKVLISKFTAEKYQESIRRLIKERLTQLKEESNSEIPKKSKKSKNSKKIQCRKKNSHPKLSVSKNWLILKTKSEIPGKWLDKLLQMGNYIINYRNIMDVRVYPPKNENKNE
ncbi:MAG: DUF790 family protein [Promethearchaeota archaeon]